MAFSIDSIRVWVLMFFERGFVLRLGYLLSPSEITRHSKRMHLSLKYVYIHPFKRQVILNKESIFFITELPRLTDAWIIIREVHDQPH